MTRPLLISTAAFGLCAIAVSMGLAYSAGCIADLKSGVWGDLNRALKFESAALLLMFLGATAVTVSARLGRRARFWLCSAVFALTVSIGYIGVWQAEISGTQHCTPT